MKYKQDRPKSIVQGPTLSFPSSIVSVQEELKEGKGVDAEPSEGSFVPPRTGVEGEAEEKGPRPGEGQGPDSPWHASTIVAGPSCLQIS